MTAPPTPPPIPLQYAMGQTRPRHAGKGFMAVCGTFLVWGLGHWLCGRTRRAQAWLLAWLLLAGAVFTCLLNPSCVAGLIFLVPLQFVLLLAAPIDAFLAGWRSERVRIPRAWQRYLLGAGLLVLAWLSGKAMQTQVLPQFVATFSMQGNSMRPTVVPGDRVLVNKQLAPHRWDLIAFHPPVNPRTTFLQRLVGLPGETVEIVGSRVKINGKVVDCPGLTIRYLGKPGMANNGCEGNPIVLGRDEYFILGDNTSIAYDSRYWTIVAPGHQPGALPADALVGVVTAVYWPPRHWCRFR